MEFKTKRIEWILIPKAKRNFVIALHWCGWNCIQIGIHFDVIMCNMEIFLPFIYIHIGYESFYEKVIQN